MKYLMWFLGLGGLLSCAIDWKLDDEYASGWGYNDRYNIDRMFREWKTK